MLIYVILLKYLQVDQAFARHHSLFFTFQGLSTVFGYI